MESTISTSTDTSEIANLLRGVSRDVFKSKGKLCLSANYLCKLNNVFEANVGDDVMTSSFHIVQTDMARNSMRDSQFLSDLVQKTSSLKIIPDVIKDYHNINVTKFNNLKVLEIYRLKINAVLGIQKLRSQLEELTCCHCLNSVSEILDKCGGDNSQRYSWSELKKANFSYNGISTIDDSFLCTISLHTLDLSHNELTKIDFINYLPNLKHLNLSYNKLESVPSFKGQISTRLQVLVLNSNFIDELADLSILTNIVQLDFGHNCLLDHKTLLALSHMSSLQWLNLQSNPISFHMHHRIRTCSYLNKNCSAGKFVLDNLPISNSEKQVTGSYYPISQTSLVSTSSNHSLEGLKNASVQEKERKIRNVIIEDEDTVKEETPHTPSFSFPSQHLEIKKQVEQLRQDYGESWLYRDSGLLVQDVLGFKKNNVLSSTPHESALDSLYMQSPTKVDVSVDSTVNDKFTTVENSSVTDEDFKTAQEYESSIFSNTVMDSSDVSDGEDICSGGDECIYLATNTSDNVQVFVVLTDTHISERDAITSKEKARWHVNTIIECEKVGNSVDTLRINFDTVRRGRKQRCYAFDACEVDIFWASIKDKIVFQEPILKKVNYQCMKCSNIFSKEYQNSISEEDFVTCFNCKSKLVVKNLP